jgi:hypothetical protein
MEANHGANATKIRNAQFSGAKDAASIAAVANTGQVWINQFLSAFTGSPLL